MPKVKVAHTSDIPVGTVKCAEVGYLRIAICNVHGVFHAIEDVCTHDGAPLDQGCLMGDVIECPRHGAQFRVTDGKVLRMPAVTPLQTFPVSVEGEDVYVEVPEE